MLVRRTRTDKADRKEGKRAEQGIARRPKRAGRLEEFPSVQKEPERSRGYRKFRPETGSHNRVRFDPCLETPDPPTPLARSRSRAAWREEEGSGSLALGRGVGSDKER